MAEVSNIEWTDATWNIITGCSVLSPGCKLCYAMRLAGTRLAQHRSRAGLTRDTKAGPVWTGAVRFNAEWLDQPLRWRRPRMIFVCAHGDLFHEAVPDEWIDKVFAVMALAPQHTFQVLTKRAARMRAYMTSRFGSGVNFHISAALADMAHPLDEDAHQAAIDWTDLGKPLPNVWLGVSAEDQERADERIPHLLTTPSAVRWLSAEPLLGPLSLTTPLYWGEGGITMRGYLRDRSEADDFHHHAAKLDWVVVGGESGPGARPMHLAWVRSLRDQCAAAGVPFFFKQWGEFASEGLAADAWHVYPDGRAVSDPLPNGIGRHVPKGHWRAYRVGKKAAGRLLDGVQHDAMPEVRR